MKKIFYFIAIICLNSASVFAKESIYVQEKTGDLFLKASFFVEMAMDYINLREPDRARAALAFAYKECRGLDEPLAASVILYEICDKYVMLQDLEKAYKIATNLGFDDVKYNALVKIVYGYVELNEFKRAEEISKEIKDPFLKAMLLYNIANRLTSAGGYEETLKFAGILARASNEITKLIAIQVMTRRYPKQDIEEINKEFLSQIDSLEDSHYATLELIYTAQRYFAFRLFEPAKLILSRAALTAQKTQPESLKEDLLEKIGEFHDRIKKFEESLDVIDESDSDD